MFSCGHCTERELPWWYGGTWDGNMGGTKVPPMFSGWFTPKTRVVRSPHRPFPVCRVSLLSVFPESVVTTRPGAWFFVTLVTPALSGTSPLNLPETLYTTSSSASRKGPFPWKHSFPVPLFLRSLRRRSRPSPDRLFSSLCLYSEGRTFLGNSWSVSSTSPVQVPLPT